MKIPEADEATFRYPCIQKNIIVLSTSVAEIQPQINTRTKETL